MNMQRFVIMFCYCTCTSMIPSDNQQLYVYKKRESSMFVRSIQLPGKSTIATILQAHFSFLEGEDRCSFLSEQLAYRQVKDASELLYVLELIILPWVVNIHQKITLEIIEKLIQKSTHSAVDDDEDEDDNNNAANFEHVESDDELRPAFNVRVHDDEDESKVVSAKKRRKSHRKRGRSS